MSALTGGGGDGDSAVHGQGVTGAAPAASTITTLCSRCGGHGLVHGSDGSPQDCPACGCAGSVWPPYCNVCGSFASLNYPCKVCERRAA